MLSIDANHADHQHPLMSYTNVAALLSHNTGEDVALTYNKVTVIVTERMSASDAWHIWHATASEIRIAERNERFGPQS